MKYQKKKRKEKKETRETTPEFIHVSGIKRRILRGTKNEWKKKKKTSRLMDRCDLFFMFQHETDDVD